MARPTSSSNRGRRSASRRPTSSQTRSTRSKTSNARVTRSGEGSRPSSTRVTRGSSASRTSTSNARVTGANSNRPALPPGKKGGQLAIRRGARRTNVNRASSSARTQMGTRGSIKPQLRLPAAKPGAAANLASGLSKVAGSISLLLSAGVISNELAASLRRGEGLARIPGLLRRMATNTTGPRRRGGGQGNRNRRDVTPSKPETKSKTESKPTTSKPSTTPKKDRLDRDERASRARINPRTNKPYSESPGKPSSPPASPPTRSSSPSKPSKPARKPQSKDMDANYRAWAAAHPELAKKVKKGQAGYKAINKTERPNPRMSGEGAPGAQSPAKPAKPTKTSSSNSTAKKVSRLAQVLAGKKGLASKKKNRLMSGRLPSNRHTG